MAATLSAVFPVPVTPSDNCVRSPCVRSTCVRSTALAHRFMVRRSLAQFRAGVLNAESQKPQPARVLTRTLKAPLPPT